MSFGEVVLTVRLVPDFPGNLALVDDCIAREFLKNCRFSLPFFALLTRTARRWTFMHRKSQTKRIATLAVALSKKGTGLQFNAANKP